MKYLTNNKISHWFKYPYQRTAIIVVFLLPHLCLGQQNAINDKKLFLFYANINHYQDDRGLFERYLQIIKQSEYNLYKNDEFKFQKFYTNSKIEYLNEIANLNFNDRFERSKYGELGTYNFSTHSFPLNIGFESSMNENNMDFFGELLKFNPYQWSLRGMRVHVFNKQQLNLSVKMDETKANLFVQSKKSSNGSVNRQVLCKVDYSVMTRPMTFSKLGMYDVAYITVYIHKIQIWDGPKLIYTIYPSDNIYDKVNGYQLKDGAYKTFFASDWSEIDRKDSLQASYYRISNYKNGKLVNPTIDYYKSGAKQNVGSYSDFWGTKNGPFTSFYENGQKQQEVNYINNEMDGKFMSWYADGEKQEEVNYIANQKNGCDYMWDESGKCLAQSILGGWRYDDHFSYWANGSYDNQSKACPCFIRTTQNSQGNVNANSQQTISTEKTDHVGHYNDIFSSGNYKAFNNTLYYKSNSAVVKEVLFAGANNNSQWGDVKINGGALMQTFITIDGFKRVGGRYSYTYSACITFENGEVYQKNENIDTYNLNEPFLFEFEYTAPKLKGGVASLPLYSNFSIKDKFSDAKIQGFYKFTLLP